MKRGGEGMKKGGDEKGRGMKRGGDEEWRGACCSEQLNKE